MGKDLGSVFLFGLINTFMLVPVSISFCAIIFRDEAFDEYMPSLVKLVLFSSALHQACFSLFSSLPFAVGQVQDAGLIFLSAMAGSIAASCSKPENIVPSTLYILGLSTAILGVMLMIVSKLRLASVVQYLPMPVIGGYLAFIGFFCGEAGLSMMAGVQVTNITQWNKFLNQDALVLLMPGLICGLGMSYCLHKFRSPLTFPLCLLSILSIFYLSMLFSGSSLQDMRDAGWIAPLDKAGSSFDAWKLYDISKVEWELFPKQIITLLGMFFVVAFSSSLDVAAIEMELGIPLDYNRELNTVGISNLVSGLLGGYTGSYIFTQTTFNMRRGINNRWCGFIIVIGEIIIALLPVSVVSFIPKMFFGSLLVLIATELLCEWLIFTHSKMMLYEYAVCLLTFVCIQMVGIEVGMLLGVIAAMFCFVISYSNLQSVSAVTVKSSTVIRTFEERSVLIANRGKVLTVSLRGYLFFGSAVKLLQEIKSKLAASDCDDEPSSISPGADGYLPISTFLGTLKDPAASASLSPPPSVPKLLSRGSLGGALPSLIDAAPTASTNKGNNGNSSAFAEMNPLIAISKQSSFRSPSHQDQVPALVRSASSQAPASYQQQQQLRVGHTHADETTASSHHSMKMLFSSHSLRQKHIPTVYDLSAEQIQNHYQSWTNSSRPHYERNFDPRDCRTDLEMGNLSHQQTSSIPCTTTFDRCNDTLIKDPMLMTPVNERTSLLTAAINNSYSKEAAGKPRDTATPKSQHCELIDAQEIRETSVFLQVWESQQQRKEQQRRRQSYSDLVGLSSSLGNREQLDTVGRIKTGLGYNFDSEENLEDLNKTPCENSEIDSNENGHESASKGYSIKLNADPIASGKIRQSTTYTSPVPPTQPVQGMLQAPPSHIAVNTQSQDMVTEYLILDFTEVIGVDATAARACFLTLVHFMRTANVTVVFANLSKPVQELLCAHNVLNEESIIIPNLDDALEWCEDQILVDSKLRDDTEVCGSMISRTRSVEDYSRAWTERQQHLHFNRSTRANYNDISPGPMKLKNPSSSIDLLSLTEGFSSAGKPISARALRHILVDYLGMDLSNPSNRFRELLESSVLTKFFTREEVSAGEIIFDIDFPATKVFFIESGVVEIVSLTIEQSFGTAVTEPKIGRNNNSEVVRVNKASHGGVFGEADFILGKTRSVRAYSVTNCTFWILDREHFAAMEVQQPQLCMLIQYALLRSLALSYTCSMYALHPTTAYADTGDDM